MNKDESNVHKVNLVDETTRVPVYLEIESMIWSQDENSLLICATNYGRRSLVRVNIVETFVTTPEILIEDSGITSMYRLPHNQLLVSSSSFVCPSEFAIYDVGSSKTSLDKVDLTKYGVTNDQVSQFAFQGADNETVQTWVLKPSFFQAGEKYPVTMFIHGGPLMAWTNNWSFGLNPLLLAEQGHIVILPNFGGMYCWTAREFIY